jgi:hypothetical protein
MKVAGYGLELCEDHIGSNWPSRSGWMGWSAGARRVAMARGRGTVGVPVTVELGSEGPAGR